MVVRRSHFTAIMAYPSALLRNSWPLLSRFLETGLLNNSGGSRKSLERYKAARLKPVVMHQNKEPQGRLAINF